jgi:hypothetical protein
LGKGRFRPPFNLLSRYREPGRINLNTIYSQLVYASLAGGTPMPSWQAFLASRRGYAAVPSDAQFTQFDSSTPTCFGNPFRSQSQWDLNPALPGARREADVTLLRPDSTGTTSLLAGNTTEAYRNNLAHPYFRYQQLNRLGNLTTTRSNVFAVWITVGFFEVEPFAVDAAHPDGYALTTELGIDTGEVRRHKAFYVIDRTIPVGYENGRDYNTGNAILHKTHVE